ncbi:unnamed protein product [Spirodela intermedia]|uniref:non-specific serine/threonine protein kinase n=1 Tax=Spirodela intermedia TaxID=51605 RepID=A0A7I8LLE5_SPIIN|nr:unnamed protein product [Spirodela intermedia]
MGLLLLLCFLWMATTAHGQLGSGFISIDCGLEGGSNYTDQFSGIVYSPDTGYVDGGVNVAVPSAPDISSLAQRYFTLRSFPNVTRNCYTIGPIEAGGKYLVRDGFLYGNHDGKNQAPEFDLYLDVNVWQTVQTLADDTVIAEIIAISPANVMQVCVVNTGMGTPFISVLEVRPLPDFLYPIVKQSQALVLHEKRVDYGGSKSTRFPADPYDRIWFIASNRTGWRTVRTDGHINTPEGDISRVSANVLTTATVAKSLAFKLSCGPEEKLYVFMHFAELQQLGSNETREFNVFLNGELWYGPYRPKYMTAMTLYTNRARTITTYNFTLEATANSTLPPIINAREVYSLKQLEESPTDARDANAILKFKDFYKVKKNWQGDPCFPRNMTWEGVSCGYDASENLRIVSLNLPHSGLAGGISQFIVNLTALKTLDLSQNNLTGEIPSDLGELPNLQVLNLANNQLTGKIPEIIYKKSQNGTLSASTDGNTKLCNKVDSCEMINGQKKSIILLMVGICVSSIVLFGTFILGWRLKGRKRGIVQNIRIMNSRDNIGPQVTGRQQDLDLERHQFSFSEIVNITRNFECMIGREGFRIVYYGLLNDDRQVVVKMLSQSSQEAKEFLVEAQILSRVHHKNLVDLLGYCADMNNLAVVYEYMPKGSLSDHLSGNRDGNIRLSWDMRLRIAIDVAQGLYYLHSFCKPSVVHRNVRTGNILLSAKLEAELGDFGLSRLFCHEDITHISTAVVGTPRYLDPEYYQTNRLNEKSDVYSFGVVLLELITNQPPISHDSRLERGDVSSITDQRLNGDYDLNSLSKIVQVAMACTSPTSGSRPKMSEVVVQLKECLESVGMWKGHKNNILLLDISYTLVYYILFSALPLYLMTLNFRQYSGNDSQVNW